MQKCLATEEGFACVNQMVETIKNDIDYKPFLWKSALNYYTAYMAKNMSFVELFQDIEKYTESNSELRWKYVLRVKRGLNDTAQKGGLYKDAVYLEGAVKVLQRRKTLNIMGLFCGKISLRDLTRRSEILNYNGLLLPPFLNDMD